MAVSLSPLRNAYDILNKMRAFIEAAKTYVDQGTAASDEEAISLLTQACNVGLNFVPSGKISLALQMLTDSALATQEADACQAVSENLVQSVDSLANQIAANLNNQSYSFGNDEQRALFAAVLADAQSGNFQGAINSANQALAIPTTDGSTTTEYPDGSLTISYTNTNSTQNWTTITVSVSTTWQATSINTEYSNATSQIVNYYGDGSSVATDYAAPNGLGAVTEIDTNNADGTSQITTYNLDGSSVTSSWTEPNGTGDLTRSDQENANGTSQITTYNLDGSSVTTDYSGPNGTGTVTKVDQENYDGTSQITTPNPNGSTTTIMYSGPNGTGKIIGVNIDSATASISSQLSDLTYDYDGTGMSGIVTYNASTNNVETAIFSGGGHTYYGGSLYGDNVVFGVGTNLEPTQWLIGDLYTTDGLGSAGISNYYGPAAEQYEYTGTPFEFYQNLNSTYAWTLASSTTSVTVSPLAGQTQKLGDVLSNPSLIAQGALQYLEIDGPGTVELMTAAMYPFSSSTTAVSYCCRAGRLAASRRRRRSPTTAASKRPAERKQRSRRK